MKGARRGELRSERFLLLPMGRLVFLHSFYGTLAVLEESEREEIITRIKELLEKESKLKKVRELLTDTAKKERCMNRRMLLARIGQALAKINKKSD